MNRIAQIHPSNDGYRQPHSDGKYKAHVGKNKKTPTHHLQIRVSASLYYVVYFVKASKIRSISLVDKNNTRIKIPTPNRHNAKTARRTFSLIRVTLSAPPGLRSLETTPETQRMPDNHRRDPAPTWFTGIGPTPAYIA